MCTIITKHHQVHNSPISPVHTIIYARIQPIHYSQHLLST